MTKIQKSIVIDAPLEKVFGFMAEPNNLPEIWPSLIEIKNVLPLPNGGYCYEWISKMAGIRFEGQAECSEFVKNQRIVDKNEGGISSTFVWNYQPEDGSTRVSVFIDYLLPGAVLARVTEPVINQMNEHEAELVLANLKTRM